MFNTFLYGTILGVGFTLLITNFFIYQLFQKRSLFLVSVFSSLLAVEFVVESGLFFSFNSRLNSVSLIFFILLALSGTETYKSYLSMFRVYPKTNRYWFLFVLVLISTSLLAALEYIPSFYAGISGLMLVLSLQITLVFKLKTFRTYLKQIKSNGIAVMTPFAIILSLTLSSIHFIYPLKSEFYSSLQTFLLIFLLGSIIAKLIKIFDENKINIVESKRALTIHQEIGEIAIDDSIKLAKEANKGVKEHEKTNKKLNKALTSIRATQSKLVQSEKMASLGQLTAGIAHELNNPINYLTANVVPLKEDISDILYILEKYNTITKRKGDISEMIEEIDQLKSHMDMDYLKQEIHQLLEGMTEGAKRTAEIVKGLRTFSRLDEGEFKKANLNDGIESTLVLLRNRTKHNIEVITNLSQLPSIECNAGKLNQVFMNMFSNAIDALEEKEFKDEEKATLTISSESNKENICITIEDNGIGMSEQTQAKLFDPFYTTKDVGKGTGLGMSIVYSIVEEHNGKIQVESAPNKGSKFTIKVSNQLKTPS